MKFLKQKNININTIYNNYDYYTYLFNNIVFNNNEDPIILTNTPTPASISANILIQVNQAIISYNNNITDLKSRGEFIVPYKNKIKQEIVIKKNEYDVYIKELKNHTLYVEIIDNNIFKI